MKNSAPSSSWGWGSSETNEYVKWSSLTAIFTLITAAWRRRRVGPQNRLSALNHLVFMGAVASLLACKHLK